MKRCVPVFFVWLTLTCGVVWGDDLTRFSQGLAPVERKETGLDRLSSDQVAVLDALVRRDITALTGKRPPTGATFSQRITADEWTNAGFGSLTADEGARVDSLVERHEAPKVARALLSAAPVYANRPKGPLRVDRDAPEQRLHGSMSVSFGAGSGGYSEMTGSMSLRYDDPKGRYSIAGGYVESHVKNARYYYYDSEYPSVRRAGVNGTEQIEEGKGDFTSRGYWLSGEFNLNRILEGN